jgi:hypothetical protein
MFTQAGQHQIDLHQDTQNQVKTMPQSNSVALVAANTSTVDTIDEGH